MLVRFNMKELVDDLMAEGYTRASAVLKTKRENNKRQKIAKSLAKIIHKNDERMELLNTVPKMFT